MNSRTYYLLRATTDYHRFRLIESQRKYIFSFATIHCSTFCQRRTDIYKYLCISFCSEILYLYLFVSLFARHTSQTRVYHSEKRLELNDCVETITLSIVVVVAAAVP